MFLLLRLLFYSTHARRSRVTPNPQLQQWHPTWISGLQDEAAPPGRAWTPYVRDLFTWVCPRYLNTPEWDGKSSSRPGGGYCGQVVCPFTVAQRHNHGVYNHVHTAQPVDWQFSSSGEESLTFELCVMCQCYVGPRDGQLHCCQ